MKKLNIILLASAICSGCRVVEVDNRGERVVTDADGKPVIVEGRAQTVNLGWNVYHNSHWMSTQADTLTASVKGGEIAFSLNGLNSEPSTNLIALVDVSLKGVALLAERVGAAVASSGGSVAKDAVAGALSRYLSKGGKVDGASVSCADGRCTITDGAVSECLDCVDR